VNIKRHFTYFPKNFVQPLAQSLKIFDSSFGHFIRHQTGARVTHDTRYVLRFSAASGQLDQKSEFGFIHAVIL
jgi:hypothetical protein